MVLAKYEDAVLVFSKWSAEGEDVVCIEHQLRGTISHDSGARFSLSTPGIGRLEFCLDAEGLVFGYSEGREIPGIPPDTAAFIIAKRSEDGGLHDRLSFITVPKQQSETLR
jgi:hypothetical protein